MHLVQTDSLNMCHLMTIASQLISEPQGMGAINGEEVGG